MENEGPIAMPARVRTLPIACGVALLVGGILALVGTFLPWVETYYPAYNVVGNPPEPGQPVFHVSPMSFWFGAAGLCGVVFLAPPLILVAQGLRVCATRQWRASGVAVAAAVAGLAIALLTEWQWTTPTLWLNDMGTKSTPDAGFSVVVGGYICALVAGVTAWSLSLDE